MSCTLLVTKDYYLYEGLKQFIPLTLIQNDIGERHSTRNGIILIDSRVSLNFLEQVYTQSSLLFEKTTAIYLDMTVDDKSPASAATGKRAVDMKAIVEKVVFGILSHFDRFMADSWQSRINVEMTETEMMLINSFIAGKRLEDIAKTLQCSHKQIYKLRDRLAERFNAKHFYHACLYIFRHDLLNRKYTFPVTWLQK